MTLLKESRSCKIRDLNMGIENLTFYLNSRILDEFPSALFKAYWPVNSVEYLIVPLQHIGAFASKYVFIVVGLTKFYLY